MALVRRLESVGKLLGFDPRRGARNVAGLRRFLSNHREYRHQASRSGGEFPMGKLYPCLDDHRADAGAANGHYFHQDLLVAQRIFRRAPERHVDVGSRIDGFVAHVASFRQIEVFDIRPLRTSAQGVRFLQCDAMAPDSLPSAYADSVSCLHALEHFGLGRYGDPVNYHGHLSGWANLLRVLRPGGVLYLSVPIGRQRVEFNGHRVFDVGYVLDLARSSELSLLAFSFVDDAGELHSDSEVDRERVANNFGCNYGCGIFEFRK